MSRPVICVESQLHTINLLSLQGQREVYRLACHDPAATKCTLVFMYSRLQKKVFNPQRAHSSAITKPCIVILIFHSLDLGRNKIVTGLNILENGFLSIVHSFLAALKSRYNIKLDCLWFMLQDHFMINIEESSIASMLILSLCHHSAWCGQICYLQWMPYLQVNWHQQNLPHLKGYWITSPMHPRLQHSIGAGWLQPKCGHGRMLRQKKLSCA